MTITGRHCGVSYWFFIIFLPFCKIKEKGQGKLLPSITTVKCHVTQRKEEEEEGKKRKKHCLRKFQIYSQIRHLSGVLSVRQLTLCNVSHFSFWHWQLSGRENRRVYKIRWTVKMIVYWLDHSCYFWCYWHFFVSVTVVRYTKPHRGHIEEKKKHWGDLFVFRAGHSYQKNSVFVLLRTFLIGKNWYFDCVRMFVIYGLNWRREPTFDGWPLKNRRWKTYCRCLL